MTGVSTEEGVERWRECPANELSNRSAKTQVPRSRSAPFRWPGGREINLADRGLGVCAIWFTLENSGLIRCHRIREMGGEQLGAIRKTTSLEAYRRRSQRPQEEGRGPSGALGRTLATSELARSSSG